MKKEINVLKEAIFKDKIAKIKYLLLLPLFALTGCPQHPEDDRFVNIENKSEQTLIWFKYYERMGNPSDESESWWGNYEDDYIIHPFSSVRDSLNSNSQQTILGYGWIKYYLMNYDSLQTIPWERIMEERIYVKEVTFERWEDFEKCNFTITYP